MFSSIASNVLELQARTILRSKVDRSSDPTMATAATTTTATTIFPHYLATASVELLAAQPQQRHGHRQSPLLPQHCWNSMPLKSPGSTGWTIQWLHVPDLAHGSDVTKPWYSWSFKFTCLTCIWKKDIFAKVSTISPALVFSAKLWVLEVKIPESQRILQQNWRDQKCDSSDYIQIDPSKKVILIFRTLSGLL